MSKTRSKEKSKEEETGEGNSGTNSRRKVEAWNYDAYNNELNRHDEKVRQLRQQQDKSKKSMEKMTLKIVQKEKKRNEYLLQMTEDILTIQTKATKKIATTEMNIKKIRKQLKIQETEYYQILLELEIENLPQMTTRDLHKQLYNKYQKQFIPANRM